MPTQKAFASYFHFASYFTLPPLKRGVPCCEKFLQKSFLSNKGFHSCTKKGIADRMRLRCCSTHLEGTI